MEALRELLRAEQHKRYVDSGSAVPSAENSTRASL
eukprot:CAMPEP_0177788586 /NCGR_PEP_ID=MMETSP0491_2-20121128/22220_1 /TAXON_ID=63592 /ORGANISM="Tetraselmis chuii, Strain PLY429" /LENGTH=34 /DNA_ID= /DNA_START= /DNA_END= /DNA_ORIENTATION=